MKPILMTMLVVGVAFAQQQQHAHSHGSAKINIGVEGSGATIEFEAPADPIVGFEHKARNAAEQAKVASALAALKSRFAELVVLPAAYGCKLTNTQSKFQLDGPHAEVFATYTVQCAKTLTGAEVRFGVTKLYPEIEEVVVQAVSESGQSGATIRKDKGSVKIG